MKYITKTLFATILFTSLFIESAFAQEQKNGLTWYNDIEKVYELSTQTGKPIFAFFTGSDWCVWCHRLESNVFDHKNFKEWANKNVILLELDFPRSKQLPEKLAKQNAGLQQFFNVQGYPTVWIFYLSKDKTTNKFKVSGLGSLGYPDAPRGKEEGRFLQDANKVLKNKT